jgi:hypothetical protein
MLGNHIGDKMTAQQVLEKMLQGYSWVSICESMEHKGMTRQEINLTMDEAKRMKLFLEMK